MESVFPIASWLKVIDETFPLVVLYTYVCEPFIKFTVSDEILLPDT